MRCIYLLAALAVGSSLPLDATTLTSADFVQGATSTDVGFALLTGTGGTFDHKTLLGFDGVGITGDNLIPGEIDVGGEAITIAFVAPVVATDLVLSYLFPTGPNGTPGPYGDLANEAAVVTINGSITGILTATGATTATWTGPAGTVTNLSTADLNGAGVWDISNPFGTDAISTMNFTAFVNPGVPLDGRNSDFAFTSLSFDNTVPEPSSPALLAAALAVGFMVKRCAGTGGSR